MKDVIFQAHAKKIEVMCQYVGGALSGPFLCGVIVSVRRGDDKAELLANKFRANDDIWRLADAVFGDPAAFGS